MANAVSAAGLFDPKLVKSMFNKVKGKSSVAALCKKTPVEFTGNKVFVFSMDNEVDLVGENQPRGAGGVTVAPVKMIPLEIEYGARFSESFMTASEEEQLDVLEAFTDGFAAKVARGIDIMSMHGVNPRTGERSELITHYFDKIDTTVPYDAAKSDDCIEEAAGEIGDFDITGIAMAKLMSSAMAKLEKSGGGKLYPELAWGGQPKEVNGVPTSVNTTVSFGDSGDRAIVGDFENCFKWGYAKEVKIKIIEYGDPDNTGKDLQGHGQIYIRGTAHVGWAILAEEAFARVVESA